MGKELLRGVDVKQGMCGEGNADGGPRDGGLLHAASAFPRFRCSFVRHVKIKGHVSTMRVSCVCDLVSVTPYWKPSEGWLCEAFWQKGVRSCCRSMEGGAPRSADGSDG